MIMILLFLLLLLRRNDDGRRSIMLIPLRCRLEAAEHDLLRKLAFNLFVALEPLLHALEARKASFLGGGTLDDGVIVHCCSSGSISLGMLLL